MVAIHNSSIVELGFRKISKEKTRREHSDESRKEQDHCFLSLELLDFECWQIVAGFKGNTERRGARRPADTRKIFIFAREKVYHIQATAWRRIDSCSFITY